MYFGFQNAPQVLNSDLGVNHDKNVANRDNSSMYEGNNLSKPITTPTFLQIQICTSVHKCLLASKTPPRF